MCAPDMLHPPMSTQSKHHQKLPIYPSILHPSHASSSSAILQNIEYLANREFRLEAFVVLYSRLQCFSESDFHTFIYTIPKNDLFCYHIVRKACWKIFYANKHFKNISNAFIPAYAYRWTQTKSKNLQPNWMEEFVNVYIFYVFSHSCSFLYTNSN